MQLALSDAPLNSEIFLFTDAPAKDVNLFSTVIALIEQTKTVVSIYHVFIFLSYVLVVVMLHIKINRILIYCTQHSFQI